MSIYQRYLSKSLIFFSMFCVIFLLFIESNIGFKWIFNLTSCIFTRIKSEEISGNWRDFTLKNIKYNTSSFSIHANSIHVILDTKSLFKKSTIFKTLEIKNLVIMCKSNFSGHNQKNNLLHKFIKNNTFIKYPVIFQKVYINKVFFKTPTLNTYFAHVSTGVKLIKNNIVITPTHMNSIHIESSYLNIAKKNVQHNRSTILTSINDNIHRVLYLFSHTPKIFIPFNINLKLLKCKKIYFSHDKNLHVLPIELQAQIKNNILKIQKINIDASFFKFQSHGIVIFHQDYSISCMIHNKILIPSIYNRNTNFVFKAYFHKKVRFNLYFHNAYKLNISGTIFLNNLDYPLYIKLHSNHLLWSIKKNCVLKLHDFYGVLSGKINNYSLSLKNIISIPGIPSIFIKMHAQGNLKSIFFKKINIYPINMKKNFQKVINTKNNIENYKNIFKLMGKINVINKNNKNIYNFRIPKIDLYGKIMKKKLSILGSVYYKYFHILEIPRINISAGHNKLYLRGSLGNKYNIYSSIDANDLEYFTPNLKGKIQAQLHFKKNHMSSMLNSTLLAQNIYYNNIYLKKINILTNMHMNNVFLGKISIKAQKIHIFDFHINDLRIHAILGHKKQKIYFLLNSNKLHINFILDGILDDKKGDWHGFFKKINIDTIWGKIYSKKRFLVYYTNHNYDNKFFLSK